MYEFAFKAYRRRFAQEYQTSRDRMSVREGILLKLRDSDGRCGYGEVAPIESFGTESFVGAMAQCQSFGQILDYEFHRSALSQFPCLKFGLETALSAFREGEAAAATSPWPIACMIPRIGDQQSLERAMEMGYQCLKLKIAQGDAVAEKRWIDKVIDATGGGRSLRLDANGGLSVRDAMSWLEYISERPIEYLEQPLPPQADRELMALANDFPTILALDESISSIDNFKLWRDRQWPGLFVLKPSLSGGRWDLESELRRDGARGCVFSSSLETKVGTRAALSIAIRFGDPSLALGFGTDYLFADRDVGLQPGSFLQRDALPSDGEMETLWKRI